MTTFCSRSSTQTPARTSALARFAAALATGLLLLGHTHSATAAPWWESPTQQFAEEFGGYLGASASPNYWNKDENDEYLWCTLGTGSNDWGLLYRISELKSATNAAAVSPIAADRPTNFYGDGWKGGAISDELGLILTGDGNGVGGVSTNSSLPVTGAWTNAVNVFDITKDVNVECDGMDFSHDGLSLYANSYNAPRNRILKFNVGDLGASGIGLTSNKFYTSSNITRIRNLSVHYINGTNLVYYGEGTGGGKVCVFDTVQETETVLVNTGLPGNTSNEIVNVKIAGISSGQMHLYVQMNNGALNIYDLNADGKSLASATPAKSFSMADIEALLGFPGGTLNAKNIRAFEVTDDEQYAFMSTDIGSGSEPNPHTQLHVLTGLPEIGVQQPAGTNLTDGISTNDFGSVVLATTLQKTFTITNSGDGNLTGLAVTKDGTNETLFSIGTLGTNSLAPGASTTFTVTFAPTSPGAKTAAIHIASNDSDENPFDITLTGTGLPAPAAPTGLMIVVAGTNRIDLMWTDNATNETDYVVDRSLNSNDWAQVALAGANATNHNDTGLTTNTLYHYRVAASNAAGCSDYAYASAQTWSEYEAWRQLHFTADELTNTVISGDNADADGDHYPNWLEFEAGTDPRNGASFLGIAQCTPGPAAGDYVVTWYSVTGKVYTLQSATNLVSPGFTNVATGLPATPALNVYTDSVEGIPAKFYRIKVD